MLKKSKKIIKISENKAKKNWNEIEINNNNKIMSLTMY